ncbi:MAG: hypothetical protein HQK54_17365, partial [Oligoflexales bacterium]|nr:hypothetical protein [Oligoflexales bacterium]
MFWQKIIGKFTISWVLAASGIFLSSCTAYEQVPSERSTFFGDAAKISGQAEWTSENGDVLLNGKVFHIKGANWFGLETGGAKLLGLEKRSMADLL